MNSLFSSQEQHQQYSYKWLISCLAHSDVTHLVNNLLMIAAVSETLENIIGAAQFIGNFAVCSFAGFLCARVLLGDEESAVQSAFSMSNSYRLSGATYGILFLTASIDPNAKVCEFMGIPAWFWVSAILFVPTFLGKFRVGVWRTFPVFFAGMTGIFLVGYLVIRFIFPSIAAWELLCIHQLKVFLLRFYEYHVNKAKHTSVERSDNLSAFIASLVGYVISLIYLSTQDVLADKNCLELELIKQWPDSMYDPICRHRVGILGCLLFHVFRLSERF
jgi:membrane associated rhomboid family serine protease